MDLPERLSRVGVFEPDEVKTLADVVARLAAECHAGRDRKDLALLVLRIYQDDPGNGDNLLDRCQIALGH